MAIDTELQEAAQRLLDGAYSYFKLMQKRGLSGGCIWLTDIHGAMIIFTRGEYKDRLLYNIETRIDAERVHNFGVAELSKEQS